MEVCLSTCSKLLLTVAIIECKCRSADLSLHGRRMLLASLTHVVPINGCVRHRSIQSLSAGDMLNIYCNLHCLMMRSALSDHIDLFIFYNFTGTDNEDDESVADGT